MRRKLSVFVECFSFFVCLGCLNFWSVMFIGICRLEGRERELRQVREGLDLETLEGETFEKLVSFPLHVGG